MLLGTSKFKTLMLLGFFNARTPRALILFEVLFIFEYKNPKVLTVLSIFFERTSWALRVLSGISTPYLSRHVFAGQRTWLGNEVAL